MTYCSVCGRPERTGLRRRLRGSALEQLRAAPPLFVCAEPLCQEVAAEAGDLLDTIFATATGGTR